MSKLEISPEILGALGKLSSLVESDNPVQGTLQSVVELSVATIHGCDAAGVTLRTKGRDKTAAATDDFALAIDNIQYELGDGPCLTALEDDESIGIDAISEEARWPEFRTRAAQHGLRSSVSHPLRNDGSVGALNLYAKRERAFDDAATQVAELFAKQAAIALRNAQTYAAARRLSDQLSEALRSRDVIGQAKGILMEREDVDDQAAFEMLTTISQHANVKLRQVAERIVDEHRRAAERNGARQA